MSNGEEKKHRGDAVLKNMGDALQEEFYQLLRSTTQKKAMAWLKETKGIEVSAATVTEFWKWYPKSYVLRRAVRVSDQLASTLTRIPEMRNQADMIRKVAQVNFELLAAENRDPKLFAMLGKAALEQARLQLEREKFEHDKKSDEEKGLDALAAFIKGNPEAQRLYDELKAVIKKAKS